jgi:hypothetical protein
MVALLTDNKCSNVIAKFGNKEYSLLSSLASPSRLTKLTALDHLLQADLAYKLTQNERDLIKISLG